jgi:hypothetical protein
MLREPHRVESASARRFGRALRAGRRSRSRIPPAGFVARDGFLLRRGRRAGFVCDEMATV